MKLMQDVFLSDSIDIQTSPKEVFNFLHNLVDDESYRAWHPEDHVKMRWEKGDPWKVGSIVYAEEYFHGKLHKLKFIVTNVIPNRKIEYAPVSRFLKRYVPKMSFTVEGKGDFCTFTALAHYRLALLPRILAKKSVENGLLSVKKHMKEEGEYLKKTLEIK